MAPINLLLTEKRLAISARDVPMAALSLITGISRSFNFAERIWLPTLRRRTLLLCNSFSLRVQYSRLQSLLSFLMPFRWLISWRGGRGPENAKSTNECTETVLRSPPTKLTMWYPPRVAICGEKILLGRLRSVLDALRALRKTLPRSLTAYRPWYPGMSFHFSIMGHIITVMPVPQVKGATCLA